MFSYNPRTWGVEVGDLQGNLARLARIGERSLCSRDPASVNWVIKADTQRLHRHTHAQAESENLGKFVCV